MDALTNISRVISRTKREEGNIEGNERRVVGRIKIKEKTKKSRLYDYKRMGESVRISKWGRTMQEWSRWSRQ